MVFPYIKRLEKYLLIHKFIRFPLMSNTSITFNSEASAYAELSITYPVRFWIYLISNILSLPCCLFVLYQFLFIRNLRESLSNHLLIVLLLLDLIYECTSISFTINYYRLNGIWQIKRPFSQIWSFLDYGMYATNTIIFAWCTIERHILIFHHRLLLNRQKRIVLHYIPLIGVPLYGLIYYSLIIFYPFCDYLYSQSTLNGVYTPCFLIDPILSKYDLIVNQIIPVLIIISFTLGLFFRFQLQKGRLRQSLEWRKQRKLIIQVLSIFIIFSGFQFP